MRSSTLIGMAMMAGLAAGGCKAAPSASGAPEIDEQLSEELAAAELREYHRHHHLGGVTQFIAMSLDTLGEEDTRRPKVEEAQDDLYDCIAPVGKIESQLLITIADGIATGPMDIPRIDADISQLQQAATAAHDCSVEAVNHLHGVLSPAERVALVDKVQAHWEVWRQVNEEAGGSGDGQRGRIAELAEDLKLTPAEVAKISAAVREAFAGLKGGFDVKEAEAHVQALSSTFVAEAFDAKSVVQSADGSVATYGAARKARFYRTVAPLLTPDQRVKLAAQLRADASFQPPTSLAAK